jgi:hypothetical protein
MRLRGNRAVFLAALLGSWSLAQAGTSTAEEIRATYRVSLSAFSLGELKVAASLNRSAYDMQADGRFSLISGMLFRVSGQTASKGEWSKAGPRPAKFTFSFDDGKKKESRELRFSRGAVSDVTILPHKKKNARNRVPVTKDQLRNVLDPFTAAFLSVRSEAPSGDLKVCERTLPVFDGQQRFDIVLKPKRVESVGSGVDGLSGPVAVCQVKYVPIGGYRPNNKGVKFVSENEDIEVWLVSPPGSAVHLPYKIVMPTAWGTGSVTLTEFAIGTSGARRGD